MAAALLLAHQPRIEIIEGPQLLMDGRFDLETKAGRNIGVVAHHSGRRDLVIYDEQDPGRAAQSVELSEDEGHTLGELLGGSPVIERLDEAFQRVEDLAISWVTIDPSSDDVGRRIDRSLADASVRTRRGAGIVAIVADSGSVPVPGGDHVLQAGDTAVVVGLPAAVEAASKLLAPADHMP
jgi:TrkA domain protein